MHLDIITRGIKHDVDRFITELQGKYLAYEYEKGKRAALQVSVRPIQLFEICFPAEHIQTILATLNTDIKRIDPKIEFILRKMLKLKKCPELNPETYPLPIYKSNIEIVKLGIKEDEFIDGREQI